MARKGLRKVYEMFTKWFTNMLVVSFNFLAIFVVQLLSACLVGCAVSLPSCSTEDSEAARGLAGQEGCSQVRVEVQEAGQDGQRRQVLTSTASASINRARASD